MALLCGIDLGSFRTPSYVAWLEEGELLLDAYTASPEEPLPPSPGGWPPAFIGIDGPQGLLLRSQIATSSSGGCRPRPLITPALFSHRTPPNREKRENSKTTPSRTLSRPVGGRWERAG